MMEMSKVSVVVPVYNSKSYLESTLYNLVNQTYKNIEIILVDDGSSDGSALICDKFSAEDSRVKVIHQNNAGICKARNCGLEHASGDFIMFSDDDDKINLEAIEKAVCIIEEKNVDFVKFAINYVEINDLGKEYKRAIQGISEDIYIEETSDFALHYKKIKESKSSIYIWNGIYKTALLKGKIQFNDSYKFGGEDFDFNCKCLCYAKKMYFSKLIIYTHYKRGNHSTAAKYHPNQIESLYMNKDAEEQLLRSWGIYNETWKESLNGSYFMKLMSILENPKCSENISSIKRYIFEYCDLLKKQGVRKISAKSQKRVDRKTRLAYLFFNYKLNILITLMILVYRKKRSMSVFK